MALLGAPVCIKYSIVSINFQYFRLFLFFWIVNNLGPLPCSLPCLCVETALVQLSGLVKISGVIRQLLKTLIRQIVGFKAQRCPMKAPRKARAFDDSSQVMRGLLRLVL